MIEQPQFRTVLRGFDPDQVTAAFTEMTASLAIARRTAAERTMELTNAQEREAALNADLDEAVARLAAQGESSNSHVFGEVGTRVSAILSLADEEAGHLRVESERYADEVRRKADAVARLLDDVNVTLNVVGEQKAMIDHVGEMLGQLDGALEDARGTTKALQAERKLAQRIVAHVQNIHARAGAEIRQVG